MGGFRVQGSGFRDGEVAADFSDEEVVDFAVARDG